MSKRARASDTPGPQVGIERVNTLNNYFQPAPADPAPAPERKSLFESNAERGEKVTVIKNGKPCSVYDFFSHSDGTLKGGCHEMCHRQFHDYMWFAPAAGSSRTAAKHTQFLSAYDSYKTAHALKDREACLVHRTILEALRTTACSECRPDPGYMSPAQRACKEWYDAKRQEVCALNDGCAHPDCPERGPDVWCVLEADHGTNPKAKHKTTGKPLNLGNYVQWPGHGGVPAMKQEAEQIEKWICRVCHVLEPTGNAGKRYVDPTTMPAGKKGKDSTELETQQSKARHVASIVHPKQQYVDAAKRRLGCCAACARPVLPGTEAGFDFDHMDESTKAKGGLFGLNGGVAGLVNNHAKAAALDAVCDLLDAEMSKCQLLCRNCHARKTWGYEASTTEF
jgi:hypothetical protein